MIDTALRPLKETLFRVTELRSPAADWDLNDPPDTAPPDTRWFMEGSSYGLHLSFSEPDAWQEILRRTLITHRAATPQEIRRILSKRRVRRGLVHVDLKRTLFVREATELLDFLSISLEELTADPSDAPPRVTEWVQASRPDVQGMVVPGAASERADENLIVFTHCCAQHTRVVVDNGVAEPIPLAEIRRAPLLREALGLSTPSHRPKEAS